MTCLNAIADATQAYIVVTSSWRYTLSVQELAAFFADQGVRRPVVAVTPTSSERHRGREIGRWLDAQQAVTGFVILDDRADTEPYAARHVQPRSAEGLVEVHIAEATRLLNLPL